MSNSVNKNITDIAMKLIQYKLKDTMLNLVYDMCDLYFSEPVEEIPKPIAGLIDNIKDYTANLLNILATDLGEREAYIKELTELRTKYAKACMPIFHYLAALNQVGEYSIWQYKCKTAEEMPTENYADIEHTLRHYINDYIDGPNDIETHYRMSKIISLIPLRMTKERYFDIVRDSLKLMFSNCDVNEADGVAALLKASYQPQSTDGYDEFMIDKREEIEELSSKPIDNFDVDSLEDYLSDVDFTMNELRDVSNYLNIAYNDINYLIALASFCIDEEYLTGEDIMLKDTIYSCIDMIKNEDYDLYAEAIMEKASEWIADNFENLKTLDEHLAEYVNRYMDTEVISEQTLSVIETYLNITILFTLELEDEFEVKKEKGSEAVDADYVYAKIDEVLSFIKSIPENISAAKNKFIRQQLLALMPIAMSVNEFNSYVTYALEGVRCKSAGVAAITDIYNLLAEFGIIPNPDDEEDECNCGHHHHHDHHSHDHNCSCGHDHSHPHLHVISNNDED